MKRTTYTLSHQGNRALIPAAVTLAFWRLRQTWRLLLVSEMGILAAVVIACAVPLFSEVSLNAGLHGILTATPEDAQLQLQAYPSIWSSQMLAANQATLSTFMQAQFGSYLSGFSQFTLATGAIPLDSSNPSLQGSAMELTGVSVSQAAPHLRVLQGRLPSASSTDVEVTVTPTTAEALNVRVGSILSVALNLEIHGHFIPQLLNQLLSLHIVGIVAFPGNDAYWHGSNFQPELEGHSLVYQAVMSIEAFVVVLTHLAQQEGGFAVAMNPPIAILWYFSLAVEQITMNQLDDLITRLNAAQVQLDEQSNAGIESPITYAQIFGPAVEQNNEPSSLERFRDRAGLVQLPVGILTLQIVALLLIFVGLVASLLIESQTEVVALLRSRGARRRHVFGAFIVQSLCLNLLALLAGPFLALLLTWLLSRLTLVSSDQSVLTVILDDPLQSVLVVGWYAVAATGGALFAMLLATSGAARRDVLALRREAARAARRPLWQRLYLDLVAIVIALTGYGVSLYLAHSETLDARTTQLLGTPLDLIGPVFLLLTGTLVFLRLFPLLMRMLAWLVAHRPGASPLLAMSQMARSPYATIRLILLLALSVAFASFTLAFNASEQQRIVTIAGQQVGADFSGTLPPSSSNTPSTPAGWERQYDQVHGILSASAGFVSQASLTDVNSNVSITVLATNPRTFAQTSLWSTQDASQSLSEVLSHLSDPKSVRKGVPAVVDAVTWNTLHLALGAIFTLTPADLTNGIPFVAVAEVQHIPGVNDSLETSGTGNYPTPGGLLSDFTILSRVVSTISEQSAHENHFLPLNHLWLRTADDQATLVRVRAALTGGTLRLAGFQDRRALIEQMQSDPLDQVLIGVLWLGTITTVFVAVAGMLLASWLHARSRLTTFALLRALGSTPHQIASVLAWEQGLVYITSLLLGGLFGMMLILTVVPGLVFANPDTPSNPVSRDAFYVIQQVLPTQIVLPATLGIAFAVLVIIFAVALGIMARTVSRPSISQSLRLNED